MNMKNLFHHTYSEQIIAGILAAVILAFGFLCLVFADERAPQSTKASGKITAAYTEDQTLVISGEGVVTPADVQRYAAKAKMVVIQNGITAIADGTFSNFTAMESVRFAEDMKTLVSIGNAAFAKCTKLESLILPSSVRKLGASAFISCSSLRVADMSASMLTTVPEKAFQFCVKLVTVKFPDSVTEIGNYAFNYCVALNNVVLPAALSRIGEYAFSYTMSMYNCSFEKCARLKTIAPYAFFFNKIKILDLPKSLTEIGEYSFAWSVECREVKSLGSITVVPKCAFLRIYNVEQIAFPATLKSIGEEGFAMAMTVNNLHFPEGLTYIGKYAFADSYTIQHVIFPKSLKHIDDYAFRNGMGLQVMVIPGNTVIGEKALGYELVVSNKDNAHELVWAEMFDKHTANPRKSVYTWRPNPEPIDGTVIYGSASSNAAAYAKSHVGITYRPLEAVKVPVFKKYALANGVLTINGDVPDYPFAEATPWYANRHKITSIVIAGKTRSVGDFAFAYLNKVKSVEIKSHLEKIGQYAFSYVYETTALTIPDTVKKIGRFAFSNNPKLQSIKLASGLTEMSNGLLSGNIRITELSIPASVTVIEDLAISNLHSLKRMTIPEGVVKIGEKAFFYCHDLQEVIIASTVKSIGDYAFANCVNLENVTLKNAGTLIGTDAFAMAEEFWRYMCDVILYYDVNLNWERDKDEPRLTFKLHGFPGSTAEQYYKNFIARYGDKYFAFVPIN